MRIEEGKKLSFDDVLIKPKRSTLTSRSEVKLARPYTFKHSQQKFNNIPVIAANMDTVGTFTMSNKLAEKFDCSTAIHKHYPVSQLIDFFRFLNHKSPIFYSMGITQADFDKLDTFCQELVPPNYICMDVANGYSYKFVEKVKEVRDKVGNHTTIMAGNVVTADITYDLIQAGADIVKVGIGPGSACTTRDKTGVGVPQLSAIIECADAAHHEKAHICADGGCRKPGDVAKALAAGADFVMLGGMLAGHYECEGAVYHRGDGMDPIHFEDDYDSWDFALTCPDQFEMDFYGMSSKVAQEKYGNVKDYRASEGAVKTIPFKGHVDETMTDILGGLRSACTYVGAQSLRELSKRTTFVQVE